MHWVDSVDDLYDFISFVVAYAPDEFPKEDFLKDDEQLNLEKAFNELRRGLEFLSEKFDQAKIDDLKSLLDESLEAYGNSKDVDGAKLLRKFEEVAFK